MGSGLKYTNHQQGQSLLETVIAVAIILVGLFGTLTLMITAIRTGRNIQSELIAYNLAREGIEVVRGIRDSNWLAIQDNVPSIVWNSGLESVGLDYTAIAVFVENEWTLDFMPDDFESVCGEVVCSQLYVKNDVYSQFNGDKAGYTATPYFRLITLRPICRDQDDKEGLILIDGQDCRDLQDLGELGENAKKVGVEAEVTVQFQKGQRLIPYTLVARLYNWKPGVVD